MVIIIDDTLRGPRAISGARHGMPGRDDQSIRIEERIVPERIASAAEGLSIGQKFVSGTFELDAEHIKAFAAQYDPQPFHMDETLAEHTFFRGLAASGWQTVAITMRLIVESGIPLREGIIGAGAEIHWPQPTRPGDILQVYSEVIDIKPSRSRPGRGIATLRSETVNQRKEVLQVLVAKLMATLAPTA